MLETKQQVDADLLDTLYARSEGNPFFVEELLTSLMTAGELVRVDGIWKRTPQRAPVPRSVQEAVQQRTTYLSADAKRLLTLAAVAGRRFNVTLLQEVMRCDEAHLLALLKEVMAAQLVVEEAIDQFAFRHALTQQAITAFLLLRERQALHRSLLQTLERLCTASPTSRARYLEELAYYSSEAGLWEQALAYAQEAGEKALRLYAQQAAVGAHQLVTLLLNPFGDGLVVALAAADQRGAKIEMPGLAGGRAGEDLLEQFVQLAGGKRGHRAAGFRMMLHPEPGVKEAQVLGDLGDGGDGGLARTARDALLDGNGRGNPGQYVHGYVGPARCGG